jgi:hypothetical protein
MRFPVWYLGVILVFPSCLQHQEDKRYIDIMHFYLNHMQYGSRNHQGITLFK